MRKLFLFSVLVVVAGLMTSCLEYREPQYTPRIYRSTFFVNPQFKNDTLVSFKDTLDLFYDNEEDAYVLDSVFLGDTIMFVGKFSAVVNNLVAVEMKWDTTEMDLWYLTTTDIDKALLKTDTVGNCICTMRFKPGYASVRFPIYVVPKERDYMKLKLSVESDSDFPTNFVRIDFPVVEAPVTKEE